MEAENYVPDRPVLCSVELSPRTVQTFKAASDTGLHWVLMGGIRGIFVLYSSNGNDIETKAEQSFDLGFVFDIEANERAYSRTCNDRSKTCMQIAIPKVREVV